MTEAVNTPAAEAPAPAPTENVVAPVASPASAPVAEAPAAAPAPADDARKFEYVPKKFLKEDGSPDFEKLSKSYVNLEKNLGKKPNMPAASVDDYDWTPPADGPELDPTRLAEFKATVLEKGFTKEQYAFVMESHQNVVNQMMDAFAPSAERSAETLKTAWGDQYKENLQLAKAGFDAYAPSDASLQDPVWNHPAVMGLLARIGGELGEDSLTQAPRANVGTSIQEQINALRAQPDYYTPANQKRMEELYGKLK